MIDTKPQNQDLREHQQDNAKKYALQRIIQTAENQKQRENIGEKNKKSMGGWMVQKEKERVKKKKI